MYREKAPERGASEDMRGSGGREVQGVCESFRTIRDHHEHLPVAVAMVRPADEVRQEVMFSDDIVI